MVSGNPYVAENGPVLFEGDEEHGTGAAQIDDSAPIRIAGLIRSLALQVDDMDHTLARENSCRTCIRAINRRVVLTKFHKCQRHAACRQGANFAAIDSSQYA